MAGSKGKSSAKKVAAYDAIIQDIFARHYGGDGKDFEFDRGEILETAARLGVKPPKNPGDTIYTFRYRKALPATILATEPEDAKGNKTEQWLILGAGDAKYRFRLSKLCYVVPTPGLLVRKIPDATPEIISRFALNDEQALLAKVRYNRLVDIFLGIAAFSLQSHLRTKIPNYGQIEIDELYAGLDSHGAQYVVPVQAKGGNDKIGVIQTIQDLTFCQERYKGCVARAVSAQFMEDNQIAMVELMFDGSDVSIVNEKHYKLVPSDAIDEKDLKAYRAGTI